MNSNPWGSRSYLEWNCVLFLSVCLSSVRETRHFSVFSFSSLTPLAVCFSSLSLLSLRAALPSSSSSQVFGGAGTQNTSQTLRDVFKTAPHLPQPPARPPLIGCSRVIEARWHSAFCHHGTPSASVPVCQCCWGQNRCPRTSEEWFTALGTDAIYTPPQPAPPVT